MAFLKTHLSYINITDESETKIKQEQNRWGFHLPSKRPVFFLLECKCSHNYSYLKHYRCMSAHLRLGVKVIKCYLNLCGTVKMNTEKLVSLDGGLALFSLWNYYYDGQIQILDLEICFYPKDWGNLCHFLRRQQNKKLENK